MKPANIELHIQELLLHSFSPGDRFRIGKAVERELARLFAEQGAPIGFSESGEINHLDGTIFEVAHGSKPEVIGAQVAQAVYGGLSQ